MNDDTGYRSRVEQKLDDIIAGNAEISAKLQVEIAGGVARQRQLDEHRTLLASKADRDAVQDLRAKLETKAEKEDLRDMRDAWSRLQWAVIATFLTALASLIAALFRGA